MNESARAVLQESRFSNTMVPWRFAPLHLLHTAHTHRILCAESAMAWGNVGGGRFGIYMEEASARAIAGEFLQAAKA